MLNQAAAAFLFPYGVSAFDLTTVVATAALLTLVVLTASFWPARRAASVDPLLAMRAD